METINKLEYRYLDYISWYTRKKYLGREEAYNFYKDNKEYIQHQYMLGNEKKLVIELIKEFGKW